MSFVHNANFSTALFCADFINGDDNDVLKASISSVSSKSNKVTICNQSAVGY